MRQIRISRGELQPDPIQPAYNENYNGFDEEPGEEMDEEYINGFGADE